MARTADTPHSSTKPVDLGYTSLEVNTTGVTKTLGPDGWTVRDDSGNRPVDPDRAEHEINPDGWHTSVGVTASNCPFCNEGGLQR
jgi:hypothetical protein